MELDFLESLCECSGDYSAEALNELKKSTPRMPQSQKDNVAANQDKEPTKPIIKLSGSFKPKQNAKDERFEIGVTALVRCVYTSK